MRLEAFDVVRPQLWGYIFDRTQFVVQILFLSELRAYSGSAELLEWGRALRH